MKKGHTAGIAQHNYGRSDLAEKSRQAVPCSVEGSLLVDTPVHGVDRGPDTVQPSQKASCRARQAAILLPDRPACSSYATYAEMIGWNGSRVGSPGLFRSVGEVTVVLSRYTETVLRGKKLCCSIRALWPLFTGSCEPSSTFLFGQHSCRTSICGQSAAGWPDRHQHG